MTEEADLRLNEAERLESYSLEAYLPKFSGNSG